MDDLASWGIEPDTFVNSATNQSCIYLYIYACTTNGGVVHSLNLSLAIVVTAHYVEEKCGSLLGYSKKLQ